MTPGNWQTVLERRLNFALLACTIAAIGLLLSLSDSFSLGLDRQAKGNRVLKQVRQSGRTLMLIAKAVDTLGAQQRSAKRPLDPNLKSALDQANAIESDLIKLSFDFDFHVRPPQASGILSVQDQLDVCHQLLEWTDSAWSKGEVKIEKVGSEGLHTVMQMLVVRALLVLFLLATIILLVRTLKVYIKARDTAEAETREAQMRRQEMFQMVSHDLKTPLSSVAACITMIGSGKFGDLSNQAKPLLSAGEESSRQMMKLIQDLLDFERIDAGMLLLEKIDVPLHRIFDMSAAALAAATMVSGVALDVEKTDLIVHADQDRIVQLLVNLLSNAIKFSKRGSTVTLTAIEQDDYAQVKVIDHGRGIPAHLKDAIFDRFRQVEISDCKEKAGTGLGLTIARALVQLHGGELKLESTEGSGTTFTFSLPLSKHTLLEKAAVNATTGESA